MNSLNKTEDPNFNYYHQYQKNEHSIANKENSGSPQNFTLCELTDQKFEGEPRSSDHSDTDESTDTTLIELSQKSGLFQEFSMELGETDQGNKSIDNIDQTTHLRVQSQYLINQLKKLKNTQEVTECIDEALGVVDQISSAQQKSSILQELSGALLQNNMIDKALEIACLIPDY